MADTLNIFGVEYQNVTGIIASDDNGNELTYTRGGGSPTLETVTKTYTPSTSAVTDTITPGVGYDGIEEVDVTVSAVPTANYHIGTSALQNGYFTENGVLKWRYCGILGIDPELGENAGYIEEGEYTGSYTVCNAIATGTTVTPTESSQTIGGSNTMMRSAVTVNAIPSNYVGSGITRRTSSDIIESNGSVNVLSGYYANNETKALSSGTEGTPTATKGAVNNHAISVTPSVTNTAGYISGGTKIGTAVSVSASELVSGTLSVTQNGTADVTNYASVDVNVSGGSGSGVAEDQVDTELESNSYTLTFTGLQGEPTSFIVMWDGDMSVPSSTPYRAISIVYDGTDVHAQTLTNTNNAQVSYDGSNFSQSYSNGTLTITSTGAEFISGWWVMSYTYGGTIGNINTADVQVGSGATSITFTGLEDEPLCWSCIFKSNFNTSNGYQRVIAVRKREQGDGTVNIYGFAMDSSAHGGSTSWSESYNNGSLTITSQGTNNGGYFHQPGYYQLTYVVADASPYEKKSATYRASTSAQTDKIEPSSGYDAMSEVNISIPAVTQTNLTADNIKSGTTVTISNGQSNLWSVTGTYSGGGGSSMNTQTVQSTSRRNSTSLGSITSLTCSKAGTYDIYWTCTRSNTSQTWGSQLYINNSAYGTENTTWTNNVQNNKLTGVTLSANQTVAVYGRSRNGYYIYAPQLTIVQTA